MSSLRRLLSASLIAVALVLLLIPGGGPQAQSLEGAIISVSKPGSQDLPIAVPKPTGDTAVDEIWAVVRNDLEMSGYFKVIDPQAYIEPSGAGLQPGSFEWSDWEVPDPVVLAKTGVTSQGADVRAEVWVYDVPGRRKLGAKAFTANGSQTRMVGHKISDEIIRQVTGEPGIFTTRFAAVQAGRTQKELYVMDVDGHSARRITHNGAINLSPQWSPSGDAIAFTSFRGGNPDLYIADLGAGKVSRLSSRPGVNMAAAWHPSADKLAVTLTSGAPGDTDLFMLSRSGEKLSQLTNAAGIDVSPSFSPDGSRIAFASERSGGIQVYTMPASGGGATRVTFQGSQNTDPAWSPRGDKIAFVSDAGSNFDVFTVNVDGKGLERITQAQGNNEDPCWSPDGRYLAFSSTRTGSSQIWMSTADGRHQVQVTQGKGSWASPSWSPRLAW